MSTGEDLSEDANPRLRGRKPKNEDILEQGVWIQHPETGVVHLITHKYQRNRLLLEGGVQVAGPDNHTPIAVEAQAATIAELQDELARLRVQLAQSEDTHASTPNNVSANSPREALDRRSGGGKSAVPR